MTGTRTRDQDPESTARPGTDPSGTDPSGTDPSGTDPSGTDPSGTDRSGTDRSGAARADADRPGTAPSAARPAPLGTSQHPAVLLPGLARLLKGSWEQRGWFALAVLGATAFALLQIATSAIVGRVTEEVVVPSFQGGSLELGLIVGGGAAILGIAVARAVAVMARRVFAAAAQFELFGLYRERLVAVYAKVPLLWHRRQSTGTLLSSVYSDVEATFFAMAPFPFALSTIAMLIYATVVVARIDPVILLVMLALILLLIVLNVLLQRFATPIAMRSQQLRAEVAEIAHESFDGANVIKSLGREDVEERRFTRSAEDLREAGIRFGYVRGWFDPLIDALPNLGILAVAVLGAWRIGDGHLTTGQLVEVAYLFTLMSLPIRSFGWVLGDLSRTVVGGGRVQQILDVDERRDYGPAPLPYGPGVLELDRVTFEYHDDPAAVILGSGQDAAGPARTATALHEVSLRADPGAGTRVLAVVGATGSGKSTLALLAAGLVHPTAGAVRLDGADLRSLTADALTADVALVLQQAFVFDETVRWNVTLGEDIDEATVRWALRVAQAEEFVDALPEGLDTELGERGGSLSGGQRQRIALARALARRPRLLVLDDATSACDPSVELAVLDGIRREMTDSTLLLIAYRKSTISLADQVVFLDHGRVADAGEHELLRERSAGYRALVDAYDEAAISHSLLEASAPPPADGPDPSAAVTAQRERTVADARERHGAGRYRHEDDPDDCSEEEER
ncbi:ABC transporter ATP-binding protein [Brachybacterium saurashtrense]|uniref:ABC transporter ATP-binding protein n=1 Tax=Brachybacterium saurashtrense TaxID=556288 RepID=A0A345YQE6_9MICO|nr:ABC transporter ATP-binding protein [Brachybacterium saurashtrense]AXK46148.1 ABC transporter ATP-binding protein [Brachybacterium saurashtrense]RRR23888.1 ABC transporter ATP-binding protein [Brachybacterium saurashtrense]